MLKNIQLLFISILFIGCGGGGSNTATPNTQDNTADDQVQSMQGKVIDGYLRYATVCIDLNLDNQCQKESEPYTFSDENGSYSLEYSGQLDNAQIITYGGEDIDTNKAFEFVLSAPLEDGMATSDMHITPLTSLLNSYKRENNLSLEGAKEKLSVFFDIDPNKLTADPVQELETNSDSDLLAKNLQVQKTVETLILFDSNDQVDKKEQSRQLFSSLSKQIDSSLSFEDTIDETVANQELIQSVSYSIKDIVNRIDYTDKTVGKLQSALSIDNLLTNIKEEIDAKGAEHISLEEPSTYIIEDQDIASHNIKNILKSLPYSYSIDELNTILSLEGIHANLSPKELLQLLRANNVLSQISSKLEEKLIENEIKTTQNSHYSFKDIELYSFNLNYINNVLRYDLRQITPSNYRVTHKFFDFDLGEFESDLTNPQIFVGDNRAGLSDIGYTLKENSIEATLDQHKVFEISISKVEEYASSRLDAYKMDLRLEGQQYYLSFEYFENLYIINDIVSSDSFTSLSDFISRYRHTPFLSKGENGLVFYDDNKLLELDNSTYTDAGYYEIKNLDGREVLLIYPHDNSRYSKNICYLLDYNKVWQAQCYQKENLYFDIYYDKNIYDAVLQNLQENFVSIDINI